MECCVDHHRVQGVQRVVELGEHRLHDDSDLADRVIRKIRSSVDNDVNIASCGSVLARMTHNPSDPSAEREHPQRNFSSLLVLEECLQFSSGCIEVGAHQDAVPASSAGPGDVRGEVIEQHRGLRFNGKKLADVLVHHSIRLA